METKVSGEVYEWFTINPSGAVECKTCGPGGFKVDRQAPFANALNQARDHVLEHHRAITPPEAVSVHLIYAGPAWVPKPLASYD